MYFATVIAPGIEYFRLQLTVEKQKNRIFLKN